MSAPRRWRKKPSTGATPAAGYPASKNEPAAPGPPPNGPPNPDGSPTTALERLLWIHPLTSLYKDAELKSKIVKFLFVSGDAILLIIVYAILLLTVTTLAWKVVYPIPDLPFFPTP